MNWFIALKVACCDAGADLAGKLRQPCRRQRAEHDWDAAGRVKEVDEGVADVLLVGVETRARRWNEAEREIEIRIVGAVAETCREARRQIGIDQRRKLAVHPAARIDDGVLLRDIGAGRKARIHGRVAKRCRPRDVGAVGADRRNFHHVARSRGEDEVALHR